MNPDDPGLSAMMKRILEKRDEMLARIDENGLLELTMNDILPGTSFEAASCSDIRYSVIPVHRARKITLSDDGRTRVLKDRTPPMECEACGGDQYLQPCPECGEE